MFRLRGFFIAVHRHRTEGKVQISAGGSWADPSRNATAAPPQQRLWCFLWQETRPALRPGKPVKQLHLVFAHFSTYSNR